MKQETISTNLSPGELLASAILETVDTLVVVWDAKGRIIRFNRACEDTTGYHFSEVEGESFAEIFLVPEERAAVTKKIQMLWQEKKPNRGRNYWMTKDGRRRLIDWSNRPLLTDDGEMRYIISAGNDITEREQTARLFTAGANLQRITTRLLQDLSTLDEVLNTVCQEACTLTFATGSAIWLLNGENRLELECSSGDPAPEIAELCLQKSLAGTVVKERAPKLCNQPYEDAEQCRRNQRLDSYLAVPLCVDEQPLGVLDVVNKPGGFTDEDIQTLQLFAEQTTFALKQAQLHKQAEKLAVLEERQRLARELHDSVTQALYSVTLYADAAQMALNADKTETANDHLHELRNMAREAMLDMRLLIFELHTPILEKEGLVTAVQTRLETVEARSGLQTALHVRGEERRLPIYLEEELYRIVQESLTNAVKHARAAGVTVDFHFTPQTVTLQIVDNGRGFNLEKAQSNGGMGLRSISERARHIDGKLSIESEPGAGTTIKITVHDD